MPESKYAIFAALNPFFEIIHQGLTDLVDGEHYFDTIADDAFFDFRYRFPGWPATIRGRADLMAQFSGYGDNIRLHSADGLVVHHAQDRRVVILEYEVRYTARSSRVARPTTTGSYRSSRSRTERSSIGETTWTLWPPGRR